MRLYERAYDVRDVEVVVKTKAVLTSIGDVSYAVSKVDSRYNIYKLSSKIKNSSGTVVIRVDSKYYSQVASSSNIDRIIEFFVGITSKDEAQSIGKACRDSLK